MRIIYSMILIKLMVINDRIDDEKTRLGSGNHSDEFRKSLIDYNKN